MRISLPWPPSVNRYWRSVGGRVLISRDGREYRQRVAGQVLEAGRPPRYAGELAVDILAWPPDRRRRDLDNVLKALLDAMEHAGVYEDDSQIGVILIRRGEVVAGGRVDVEVVPCQR